MTDPSSTYVVGAGQAGCELALSLRQQGCAGPIIVIGAEEHPPYQRPPLSKAYLRGEVDIPSLYLREQAAYDRASVSLLLNARVERIDAQAKMLLLADGRQLPYDKLALATGGRVRRLTGQDAERAEGARNCHYLRTIGDVLRIRGRFTSGQRLVIIGGGYIGLEVASAAVTSGLRVTLLEMLPRVLARVTGPEMSTFYERAHRDAGVDLRTGVEVTGFDFNAAADAVTGVRCSDGSIVAADLIVVGIGQVPNTELALSAGLAVDNGIVVDEYARTSDPDIVAAGDCTNHPNVLSGRRLRLESVANAIEQARTAAATLTGKQRIYDAVAWFWSDQYDLKLQMVGLSHGYDDMVLRGSMSERSFAAFYLKEGQVVACDAVNRLQDFMVAKRLVSARCRVSSAVLSNESVPLKSLLEASSHV